VVGGQRCADTPDSEIPSDNDVMIGDRGIYVKVIKLIIITGGVRLF